MYEKTCQFYVTDEYNDKVIDYVHCEDENGFCLMQDLFTPCSGKCKDYIKDSQYEENK